jgi:hypothetical protein
MNASLYQLPFRISTKIWSPHSFPNISNPHPTISQEEEETHLGNLGKPLSPHTFGGKYHSGLLNLNQTSHELYNSDGESYNRNRGGDQM